jgi:hypothetical protein
MAATKKDIESYFLIVLKSETKIKQRKGKFGLTFHRLIILNNFKKKRFQLSTANEINDYETIILILISMDENCLIGLTY